MVKSVIYIQLKGECKLLVTAVEKISFIKNKVYKVEGRFYNAKNDSLSEGSKKTRERLAVLERDPNFQLWLGAFVKRCTCV